MEFKISFKKMLLKNSISSSYATNCVAFDITNFEIRWHKKFRYLFNMGVDEESIPYIPLVDGEEFNVVKDNIL